MDIPFVDAVAFRRLVTYEDAIAALRAAFTRAEGVAPQRSRFETTGGDLLLMPAWDPAAMGVKLVTVNARNPARGLPLIHALYVLFDADGAPVALIDGEALTAVRTAAVSAVATDVLAPPEAGRLVVFGAGTQARAHVESMAAVRRLREVTIVSRDRGDAEALAADTERLGVTARAGSPADVANADLVCTCTTSPTPLFDGASLRPGTHVNAIGSYRPDARELDDATMARASVVVEDRGVALTEAGDVVIAIERGVVRPDVVQELGEVLRGVGTTGPADNDVTVFKSVGVAFEDLAIARLAAEALARG